MLFSSLLLSYKSQQFYICIYGKRSRSFEVDMEMDSMGFKYLFVYGLFYFCFECDLFKLSSVLVLVFVSGTNFGQFFQIDFICSKN